MPTARGVDARAIVIIRSASTAKGRTGDLKPLLIAARALVYGFARMKIDGHFPRWGVADAETERTAEAMIDLFIAGIRCPA